MEIPDYVDLEGSGEYQDVLVSVLDLDEGPPPFLSPSETVALFWLAREIKVHADDLGNTIVALRRGDVLYHVTKKQKRDGTWKKICAPTPPLKLIQRRVDRHILRPWKPARNAFGFSGGSIVDALTPHLGNKSMLQVDLVEAFPTIRSDRIFEWLTEGRKIVHKVDSWLTDRRLGSTVIHRRVIEAHGHFSWHVARFLTELATFEDRLPRGAPTSPRIFDQICRSLDNSLQRLATNVEGIYTRYADNIFFSMDVEYFPQSVRNAILKRIWGKRRMREKGQVFDWHKLKIVSLRGEAVRALGLNIFQGEIHNVRAFKRRVRLSVHHVAWLLDHGMNYEEAWQRLQGQMQFAKRETLPPQVCSEYDALEERIASLS